MSNTGPTAWIDGTVVEQQTLEKLLDWINKGGVLVWNGTNVREIVEGATKFRWFVNQ